MTVLNDILLLESKKKYEEIFKSLLELDTNNVYQNRIKQEIENAKIIFKREDRIIWYLRYFRLWIANELKSNPVDKHMPERIDNWIRKEYHRVALKAKASFEDIDNALNILHFEMGNIQRNFTHIMQMTEHVPKMDAYVFNWQLPIEIIRDMKELEEEWSNLRKEQGIEQEDTDTIIIKFPDGSAWFNLNKPSCSDEAEQMGHCGNAGGWNNETIFSFRTPTTENFWKPHLTFIYHISEKSLGEMKGRANEMPAEKYHPYIVELLKLPIIQEVAGGGYLPENNFRISHLSDEHKNEVFQANPALKPLSMYIKEENYSEKSIKNVLKKLQNHFSSLTLDKFDGENTTVKDNIGFNADYVFEGLYGKNSSMHYYHKILTGDEYIETYHVECSDYIKDFLTEEELTQILKNESVDLVELDDYGDIYDFLEESSDAAHVKDDLYTACRITYEHGLENELFQEYKKHLKLESEHVYAQLNDEYINEKNKSYFFIILELKDLLYELDEGGSYDEDDELYTSLAEMFKGNDIDERHFSYSSPDMKKEDFIESVHEHSNIDLSFMKK